MVEGIPRRLLSLTELANGDLVVNLQAADNYRDFGNPETVDGSTIINQKYSVHRSLESKENINAIVHRINLEDGREETTSNYTKALKQTNRYAGLFIARAPNLSLYKYGIKPEERDYISLAEFEPSNTLYYMVLVSGKTPAIINPDADYDTRYFEFTHFCIAVVWSFAFSGIAPFIMSHSSGAKGHFMTLNPSDLTEEERKIVEPAAEGFSPDEAVEIFRKQRNLLRRESREIFDRENPSIPGFILDTLFGFPFSNVPISP